MARPLALACFFTALLPLAAPGCGPAVAPPEEQWSEADATEPEEYGVSEGAIGGNVEQAIQGSCSTTSVKGLSEQIVAQVNCLVPGALAKVPERPNLALGAAAFPYLQTAAQKALVNALDDNPGKSLTVNSMLRTVAQQYLLYRWYQAGRCGISAAAKPGNSNHEFGLALDTSQYSTWKSAFANEDFAWFGSADKVHFDYKGPGKKSLSGVDVKAFQILWNRNHPEDTIAEDGAYGSKTAARLAKAPAAGFQLGASCDGGNTGSGGAGSGGGPSGGGSGGSGGNSGSGGSGSGGSSGSSGSGGSGGNASGGAGGSSGGGGSSGIWAPTPGTSWQWQLSGSIDESVQASMYDIDLFDVSASVIDSLHSKSRVVICYFSAGSREDWRPDAGAFQAADHGNALDGWPGETWLDVRSANVRTIMKKRLDLAVQKGCDGVEPDNVDGYQNSSGFPLTATHQKDYLKFLAAEAHARGLSIGLKNALGLVPALVGSFDWALNEQCLEFDECGELAPFVQAGKAVFHVEYASSASAGPAKKNSVCGDASTNGFSTLIKTMNLDAYRLACP